MAAAPSSNIGESADDFRHLDDEALQDEIDITKCIINSLLDDQNLAGEARNQLYAEQKKLEDLRSAMNTRKQVSMKAPSHTNHARPFNGRDNFGGPSGYSTPASVSTWGGSTRKRGFPTHFEDDDSSISSRHKSSRTTPSPLQTSTTTPLPAADDAFVPDEALFDLTGFDGMDGLMKEQEAAFARLEQEKKDQDMARSLDRLDRQQQIAQDSPTPSASQGSGPTAFDRILGRPTESWMPTGSLSSQGPASAGPSGTNTSVPAMPGSFHTHNDDEDSLFGDTSWMNRPDKIMPATQYSNVYSTNAFPSVGLASPNAFHGSSVTAAESARQAAFARHNLYNLGGVAPESLQLSNTPQYPLAASSGYRPGMLSAGVYEPLQYPVGNSSSLASVIHSTNGIDWSNGVDAQGNPLSDRLKNYYEDLQDDPRKTDEEIRDLLQNIRPDEEIPVEERIGTPEELRQALYTHQQLALQWMQKSEDSTKKGGILADDMGLGKTISTLALIMTRKSSTKVKTNLIVGPVALIKQWETELAKKTKREHSPSVCLFHGRNYTYEQLRVYDVVLTTYGKLGQEEKRYQKWIDQHPGADPAHEPALAKSCPLVHVNSKFHRIVLDEAQCIKNSNTLQAKGACRVAATYRWCLTGTPMMNGVHELASLIKFLRIAPYHNEKKFGQAFGCLSPKKNSRQPGAERNRQKAMDALRALLRAVMLRRMKDSTIDGKPLLELPPKTEQIIHVDLDDEERNYYMSLEAQTKITINKYIRAGTVGKNYSNVLVLLLRLRQACCHPHLNLDVEYTGNNEVTKDQMIKLAESIAPGVVERLKRSNQEGFSCPICLDAVIDPTIVLPCGHNSCGECFTTMVARATDNGVRAGDENSGLTCPECRGPIDPKNVINFSTFKAVHMPDLNNGAEDDGAIVSETGESEDEDDSSDSDSDSDSRADGNDRDDVDQKGNLKGFVVNDDEVEEVSDVKDDDDDFDPSMVPKKNKRKSSSKRHRSSQLKGKEKGKGKAKQEKVAPHMLKTLRMAAKKNRTDYKRYMKYLKKNWLTSAKVNACCELLKKIQESGEKTIVFSQFTFFLDLLEIPIKYELGIKYCRYDGGMTRQQRDAAAQDFQDQRSRTKVMLVSLKAGNAGLNLTAATQVIIMDPFWNPFIEMQAVDRAYRIGQQKPVQVHRILARDTVEDRIATIQEEKRHLVNAALDEGESKQLGRLSIRDLQFLFNGR